MSTPFGTSRPELNDIVSFIEQAAEKYDLEEILSAISYGISNIAEIKAEE